MKPQNIYTLFLLIACLLCSCGGDGGFVIKGRTSQERLNGHLVFLVPYGSKHIEDSIGVDSVVIADGRFEFRGKGQYLARLTMDYRVRYGTQDLLVVTDGEVEVTIDSVSSGRGTPQNDALQTWKERLALHNDAQRPHIMRFNSLWASGDTAQAYRLRDSLQAVNEAFRQDMIQFIETIDEGTVHDFLQQMYGR